MGEHNFQIGDRVRAITNIGGYDAFINEGDEGVVVAFGKTSNNPGVDWGRDIGGHTCYGTCPIGHGRIVFPKHIELVTEATALDISDEEFFGLLKDQ